MDDHSICNPYHNPPEKLEDRTKSSSLEMKHLQTSMPDNWTTSDVPRHMVKVGVGDDTIEEKIPRLPAGGRGWDKKRKRKRSLGAAIKGVIVGERNVKQAVCAKQNAEMRLQPLEAQSFRALSRMVGGDNSVKSHLATPLGSCDDSRFEIEGLTPLRDSGITTEEKIVVEGINKTDIHESEAVSSSSAVKRKISGTQRTCSFTVLDSSPDFHDSCGADGHSEQSINTMKSLPLSVANSNNGPMSSTQRPSILPTRRSDLVPPVSNIDGVPHGFLKLDGASPFCGTGGSLLAGSVDAYNPKGKMNPANFSSPPASFESGISGCREINPNVERTDTIGAVDNASIKAAVSIHPTRKKDVIIKGRTRNSVESRGKMSSAKSSVTPLMENIENLPTNRPPQSARCGSYKSRSKSSCPPKKQMIRKTTSHPEHVLSSCFPDNAGELDDLDELLVAADSARKAYCRACSSLFWKKMECYFASVTSHDEAYLKHQLDFAEALSGSFYQMPRDGNNDLDDLNLQQDPIYSGRLQESPANQESNKTAATCGGSGVIKTVALAPSLYQRVLSAIIEEDESKQMTIQNEGRNDLQCASDDSHCDSSSYNNFEPQNIDGIASKDKNYEPIERDIMDSQIESKVDQQVPNGLLDKKNSDNTISSNTDSNLSVCSTVCNSEHWQADDGLSYYAGLAPQILYNDPGSCLEASPVSSSDSNYHMLSLDDKILLELQSIGLCPETMPQLAEGEKTINEDILELQAGLFQQAERMKKNIGKIYVAVPYVKNAEKRNMEQVGMSKLIEMAYKKRMVSCRSNLSKRVVRKVSKQVALAFAERTLARCRKFEETGRSCFSEAALQNIMFPTLACHSDNPVKHVDTGSASSRQKRCFNHNLDLMSSGYVDNQQYVSKPHEGILNKGMKRGVLLNNVASASAGALLVSVKGKITERSKDQTIKITNNSPGIDHLPVGSSQGVPKSIEKPMQKENYLLASEDAPWSRFVEPTHDSNKPPHASSGPVANEEKEKHVANYSTEQEAELGSFEHEDYTALLNFDVDGLQDQDLLGLEIPMDDLSDVNLFM